ncbi:hypothetical protein OGAPHI_000429 [Ogataea philodendri]|uniref:Uncharacterized protein n=1 Tax=Ogataea philodendri TaxID=1378263 RepID=A0A9P8PHZ8_9ASCO|nr:uncharacterized protein OGAPHI_000429 [Ogataea philodendri]KAH3671724.1 hypothetical protein OGAPHI_000429 [Ogataea philodendri]
MSDSKSRLLSQIPLIAMPGSYEKPRPVTLPYDFEQLPSSVDTFKQQEVDNLTAQLKELKHKQQETAARLNANYGQPAIEQKSQSFASWERDIRRVAPGYFGADGKIGVMTPTKHLREEEKKHMEVDDQQQQDPVQEPASVPEEQIRSASHDLANLRIE